MAVELLCALRVLDGVRHMCAIHRPNDIGQAPRALVLVRDSWEVLVGRQADPPLDHVWRREVVNEFLVDASRSRLSTLEDLIGLHEKRGTSGKAMDSNSHPFAQWDRAPTALLERCALVHEHVKRPRCHAEMPLEGGVVHQGHVCVPPAVLEAVLLDPNTTTRKQPVAGANPVCQVVHQIADGVGATGFGGKGRHAAHLRTEQRVLCLPVTLTATVSDAALDVLLQAEQHQERPGPALHASGSVGRSVWWSVAGGSRGAGGARHTKISLTGIDGD